MIYMEKVYEFGDSIKKKVLSNSLNFFKENTEYYRVNFDFSYTAFSNFINIFYEMYEYKNKVFKFEEDMKKFLLTTLNISLVSGKKNISIDDIRDGIWEASIREDSVDEIKDRRKKREV